MNDMASTISAIADVLDRMGADSSRERQYAEMVWTLGLAAPLGKAINDARQSDDVHKRWAADAVAEGMQRRATSDDSNQGE